MPDTKRGRERQGKNKRSQLESQLAREEIRTLEQDDELPRFERTDGEFLADEVPDDL